MATRDVDNVDSAKKLEENEEVIDDPGLVWWLIDLAQRDRALYRRVRAIAWDLVVERSAHSAIPNNLS